MARPDNDLKFKILKQSQRSGTPRAESSHCDIVGDQNVPTLIPNLACHLAVVSKGDGVEAGGQMLWDLDGVDNAVLREVHVGPGTRCITVTWAKAIEVRHWRLELRTFAHTITAISIWKLEVAEATRNR